MTQVKDGMDPARRTLLKLGGAAVGATAFVRAIEPVTGWSGAPDSVEQLLQKHYKELTREEMEAVLDRIEVETEEDYGAEVHVKDVRPQKGRGFMYGLNLSRCVGCRKCAEACHKENNHDRPTATSYIRVLQMNKGSLSLEHAEVEYDGPVPDPDHFYMPVQCHQCDNPPCVKVCPVEATWKEPDGIVVVDYDWCIGCRYCEAACPYHARRFNWSKPQIPAEEINPEQAYLSNRIRPSGVMEKCTWCLHRTRVGRLPACLEACPTGSRVFGDADDPDSDILWVLRNKRVFVLKEELGTLPRFFYYFDK